MKKIPLSDLPLYSPWPARLLGLSKFSRAERTEEDVLREYDTDKYGSCINYFHEHPDSTIEDVKWFELGGKQQSPLCISVNEQLYASSIESAYKLRESIFLDSIENSMHSCDTVIELGAGYGHNLGLLQKRYKDHTYLGGEFSPNAITLANKLLSSKGIKIHPFNFYDKEYEIFNAVPGKKILVLTYHSSEMLPDVELFLKNLEQYKDRIISVVQLEPVYEMAKVGTMLGLLRRSYIKMNHYNTNLLTALQNHSEIEITRTHYDMFGVIPSFQNL